MPTIQERHQLVKQRNALLKDAIDDVENVAHLLGQVAKSLEGKGQTNEIAETANNLADQTSELLESICELEICGTCGDLLASGEDCEKCNDK